MKQLAQRLKDGQLRVLDVPPPELDEWKVLVRTQASLVSVGTERAKVEVARKSLVGKARRRPDDVRQVLDKVRTDGVAATVAAVRSRLEMLTPLGYCAAGVVEEVGSHVRGINPGDVVACGGETSAHAEVLAVPGNLCVAVPGNVDVRDASFTTLGAIAMHGFRQADVRLGERVGIVGLGLVGQLTARIARAAGCEVFGTDLEDWRLELAQRAGSVDVARSRRLIGADDLHSCDAVIVAAAAPTAGDPISLATDLARERGTLVVVGDVLLHLDRRRMYAKELELRLARSYGPGRYDNEYEQRALDYPLAYVRWTERRNMSEFVKLLGEGRIEVSDLVTHTFPIGEAVRAFELVTSGDERSMAVVIEYPDSADVSRLATPTSSTAEPRGFSPSETARVGFVGAGSFARRHLIPLARRHELSLERVATASGLSAVSVAEEFGFARGACSVDEILADDEIDAVVVASRHDAHARLTREALRAGKAVFCEKPLCLTPVELDEIRHELARDDAPPLMVGFNRRFAPLTAAAMEHLATAAGPTSVLVRVSAGRLPVDHWLNDPKIGGGRLLGEGCHFVDLITYLVRSEAVSVVAHAQRLADEPLQAAQEFVVSMRFADGSLGTLVYGSRGAPTMGKELIEAHRADRSARIEDFRSLRLWGAGRARTKRSRRQDKGHSEEMRVFADVVRGRAAAPPAEGYLTSTALTLAALRSLETGAEIRLDEAEARPVTSLEET